MNPNKIGFVCVPWSGVPSNSSGSMGIMVDKVSRCLPVPMKAVVVSGTHAADPGLEAEGVTYLRLQDRLDRYLLKSRSCVESLLPGRFRDYHFSPYFHRFYAQRAAAFLADQNVGTVVFPIYPQWAPRIRALNPDAKLVLWMQCEWLSAGPAYYERHLDVVDRIACCSGYIADKIAQRFPAVKDKLRIVPNGVDTRLFFASKNRCRHQILYSGRLTPEKGAHVLMEAFKRILSNYPDAQLVLAGPFWTTPPAHLAGSPREEIMQWKRLGRRYEALLRRDAHLLKSVFLTGHVPHKALAGILRTASVFVHPALWNEPFGMILAEAMASGLPIVTSRCGGIPEVIEDGRSGILTDPGDVDGIVAAIERLFENRDLAARMGKAAGDRAHKLFTWKRVAGKFAEIAGET